MISHPNRGEPCTTKLVQGAHARTSEHDYDDIITNTVIPPNRPRFVAVVALLEDLVVRLWRDRGLAEQLVALLVASTKFVQFGSPNFCLSVRFVSPDGIHAKWCNFC